MRSTLSKLAVVCTVALSVLATSSDARASLVTTLSTPYADVLEDRDFLASDITAAKIASDVSVTAPTYKADTPYRIFFPVGG